MRWPLRAAFALAMGCGGSFGAPDNFADPAPKPDAGTDVEPPSAVVAPLRRLTRAQYERSVRDALGDALPEDFAIADGLPPDDRSGGFSGNTVVVTDLVLEQYETVAERIAAAIDPVALGDDPLGTLAPRLLRRPLPEDVRLELDGQDTATFVRALLLSPSFLYRT